MKGRLVYKTPTIEVIEWDEQDVITSSYDKGENDIFFGLTGEWV